MKSRRACRAVGLSTGLDLLDDESLTRLCRLKMLRLLTLLATDPPNEMDEVDDAVEAEDTILFGTEENLLCLKSVLPISEAM